MGHGQIPAFLHDMDVLLAPYPFLPRFYFSPLKLFEYLASGRTIVASAIGQIDEILTDDVDGRLLSPGDAGALAQCCIELAGDASRRSRLGTAARLTANSHTWEQNARTILGRIADGIGSR
jgi:glycosyltransferase involved in cell wall biosynthesis